MALPTFSDLMGMDIGDAGRPFMYGAVAITIDLMTLDVADGARPFVSNYDTLAPDTGGGRQVGEALGLGLNQWGWPQQ